MSVDTVVPTRYRFHISVMSLDTVRGEPWFKAPKLGWHVAYHSSTTTTALNGMIVTS